MKILHFTPSLDATSFYRGAEPLSYLDDVEVVESNEMNWSILRKIDVVFIQRPSSYAAVAAIKMAKENGKPVWIDYDDDLFSVPKDNPSYAHYNKNETRKALVECLLNATIVTVSTEAIKTSFTQSTMNVPIIEVIPNAHNDFRWKLGPTSTRNSIVYWRGSETHLKDLYTHSQAMSYHIKKDKKHGWLFIGPYPWMFDDLSDKVVYQPSLDVIRYFEVLKAVKPKINVVPLHLSPFNEAKSNIAWLEATYAGAVTLAPDTSEWRKAGITNYKNPEDFRTKLGFLLSLTDNELSVLHSLSLDAILQEKLLLSETNKLRLELLGRLTNGSSGTR